LQINNIIIENDYTIIASAINKKEHINKYGKLAENVYQLSLSYVIERSIFALDDKKSSDEPVSIIIEKRGKKEDNELKDYFNKILQRGTGYVDTLRLNLHRLEMGFKDKKEDISGLQLADLLAYPIARYFIDKDRANPAFELLKAKFYMKNNKNFGMKEFP